MVAKLLRPGGWLYLSEMHPGTDVVAWESLDVEVDFLKIDGAWVRDATIDELSRQVVEAIASTAHTLGARTIAEWVENESTRDFLNSLGIDFVQGFHTGRPAPLDPSH